LILVDGSALVYRSHYAFIRRPLTAPSGEITSVAYGFCNGVLRLIDQYRPRYLAVVFDLPDKTFRHELYTEYKANRKPMPEELVEQIPRLRELLAAWGVAVLEKSGYEADDVMATLARRSTEVCDQAWFFTGDKDFMQLLDARTGMLKPGRRGEEITTLTAEDVERIYKLKPAGLIDVFALSGDQSDNIPGAPGVGEKTALKLIHEFGDLETMFAKLEGSKLTPRLKRILTENREQVLLSRTLFIINRQVPIEFEWEHLRTVLPVGNEVTRLLGELDLRRIQNLAGRLARELGAEAAVDKSTTVVTAADEAAADPAPQDPPAGADAVVEDTPAVAATAELARRGYRLLADEEALREYLAQLDAQQPLAVDTETDGLRVDTARLVGISLAQRERPAAYVPVLTRDTESVAEDAATLFPVGSELDNSSWVRPLLAPVLADDRILKIGQNLKYDEWILSRHGLPLAGPRYDTMLASYVLDPGRRSHGLDELVLDLLEIRAMSYNELFAAGSRRKDILDVPLPRLAVYAAEDADLTLRLYDELTARLAASDLAPLFHDVEMPVSRVLLTMERNGIKIDEPFLAGLRDRFAAELERLEASVHEAAGTPFNIQSPKQLSSILFDKIGLKPVKKTATGWSTDVSVLTVLAEKHPLPALILEYRQVAKLQNTYVETLPTLANPATGLIHTSFNQAVAATGRLSSSDPNLQNIPVRTELGRLIRRAFVPRQAGHVFLAADYSQVELRLLAHLSGDAALTAAFQEGGDVHRRTAAQINQVDEAEVTPEMRSRAKAINFGVIYGMGARALAKQIDVTTREASAFIDTYFQTYPGVREFIDTTIDQARREGYVKTLLGRRRWLPDIDSSNNRVRSFQERIAVNTPIQGTAADLIKLAMIRIDADLRQQQLAALLLLQVHDELVLEVPVEELDRVSELVRTGMEQVYELEVPLVVDICTGNNWEEAHA